MESVESVVPPIAVFRIKRGVTFHDGQGADFRRAGLGEEFPEDGAEADDGGGGQGEEVIRSLLKNAPGAWRNADNPVRASDRRAGLPALLRRAAVFRQAPNSLLKKLKHVIPRANMWA